MPAILNVAQRRQAGIRFRRIKSRIKNRKKILSKRVATGDRLNKLARRAAIRMVRGRISKKAYSQMSPSEKMTLQRKVHARSGLVNRLTTRLRPSVKKQQIAKVSKGRQRKEEETNEIVEAVNFVIEAMRYKNKKDILNAIKKEKHPQKKLLLMKRAGDEFGASDREIEKYSD